MASVGHFPRTTAVNVELKFKENTPAKARLGNQDVKMSPIILEIPESKNKDSNLGLGVIFSPKKQMDNLRSIAKPCTLSCDINFRIKNREQTHILKNVQASFQPGQCTALMGPSGAGKTSLLNVLCGRSNYGTIEGSLIVNGSPLEPRRFRKQCTLVPQEDLLWSSLTVEQTLMYMAELRLNCSRETRRFRVDAVMKSLGIYERRNVRVGNALDPTLSGGQKKRLSIAIELLADRPILMVDEPTSGLDAATADDVTRVLCSLANERNMTVICTIHQPTFTSLLRFHQLIVLDSGCTVYRGPVPKIVDYLATVGAPCPPNENPADHLFKVLQRAQDGRWAKEWVAMERVQEDALVAGASPSNKVMSLEKNGVRSGEEEKMAYPTSILLQTWVLFRRFMYVWLSDPVRLRETVIPQIMIHLLLGIVYFQLDINNQNSQGQYYNALNFGSAAFLLVAMNFMRTIMGSVGMIPTEKAIVLREYRNGTYCVLAYWVARVARCAVDTIISTSLGTPIIFFMIGIPNDPWRFFCIWGTIALLHYVASLLALCIGCLVRDSQQAVQKLPPLLFIFMLHAGNLIPYDSMAVYSLPVYYANPLKWAFSALVYAAAYDNGPGGDFLMDYFHGPGTNEIWLSFVVLASTGFVLTCGGYFLLKRILKA